MTGTAGGVGRGGGSGGDGGVWVNGSGVVDPEHWDPEHNAGEGCGWCCLCGHSVKSGDLCRRRVNPGPAERRNARVASLGPEVGVYAHAACVGSAGEVTADGTPVGGLRGGFLWDGAEGDGTGAWRWHPGASVHFDTSTQFVGVRSEHEEESERLAQRQEIADARKAVAAERQAQREHELAMAEVEGQAALVELRIRLEHAWRSFEVGIVAFLATLGGWFLGLICAAAARQ